MVRGSGGSIRLGTRKRGRSNKHEDVPKLGEMSRGIDAFHRVTWSWARQKDSAISRMEKLPRISARRHINVNCPTAVPRPTDRRDVRHAHGVVTIRARHISSIETRAAFRAVAVRDRYGRSRKRQQCVRLPLLISAPEKRTLSL